MNDDERDREIERTLFEAALDLADPALREAFLDKTCAADPALRERLGALLAAHVEAATFFDFIPPAPPGSGETAPPPEAPADPPVGKDAGSATVGADPARIGRYRIVRRLGEGGCGVVYLAEQEEPVRRQVALKIIRLGMDTERVIARFALERQALAMMNHPHIARVFDAGATDAGRPFFVMELVTGERITTYCDTRRLSVRERLDLFIQVCLAVQHAHQKGILHRDLKPSNVLVAVQDGVATPKIIDFGVAKAVSSHAADEPSVTLGADQFIGTPAYMSPEQAEPGRGDVDTRADIYSLGALLYELLTGRPPFDSKHLVDAGLDALRHTLREVDPPAPSALLRSLPADAVAELAARRRCTPSAITATLRRDLDWVVMRALEKDRQRRYSTAQGLAVDLRRYLDDEPVVARPPGGCYQLGKLVRRHRFAFVAGAAILATLLGGLGASTWLYLRERAALQEQTRLRAIAEDAEKISNAVFLSRENRMEEANSLLAAVRHSPDRPSFEGLTAYRTIGTWLGGRQRWAEAADRFAVVERVGQLDSWRDVTMDHHAYGVALLMSNDVARYETFRHDHAKRFAAVENGDAVGRVLKICLLRPADAHLQQSLHALGERVERWFSTLPNLAPLDNGVVWSSLPVALWRYRQGDISGARYATALGYDEGLHSSALTASKRALLALCALSEGHRDTAASLLATARADIAAKFASGLVEGKPSDGFWYDWAFAKLLLDEAESLAAAAQGSTR
jgi:eukaryotic-like serine/threonine-protein kinase